MDRHTTDDTTHAVQRLRKALDPGLPHAPSLIPLDILVTVTAAHREGAPDRQAAHRHTLLPVCATTSISSSRMDGLRSAVLSMIAV